MKITIDIPDWLEVCINSDRTLNSDEEKMLLAIEIARKSIESGGGPFGAVIINKRTGKLLSCGANLVVKNNLSILHAEIVAIMIAQKQVNSYSLAKAGDFELFSSSEPCAMCLGAILWSGVKRVVWGASSRVAREIGFDEGPVYKHSWEYLKSKGIEIKGGVKQKEAEENLYLYKQRNGAIYNP